MTNKPTDVGVIRAEMARAGVTQTELAKTLGVSQPWVARRVNGQVALTLEDLRRIGAVLGVDLIALIAERAA